MSSGTRLLVKILVAVVSYGVTFALAIFALSQAFNGNSAAGLLLVIPAICGYRAVKYLPSFYFFGGEFGGGFLLTLLFLALRVLLSVFIGVFIAPWMIAKKLVSLVPGGEVEEAEEE